uniref:Protein kinase domain-containing protein n=2 Tax=Steinernema glaseri TaxID=37863 RepID=A0A1I7ZZ69_9BILA
MWGASRSESTVEPSPAASCLLGPVARCSDVFGRPARVPSPPKFSVAMSVVICNSEVNHVRRRHHCRLRFTPSAELLPKAPSDGLHYFDQEELYLQKPIGAGAYGQVYEGILQNHHRVAVKTVIAKKGCNVEEVHATLTKEAKLMAQLRGHENVVRLFGLVDKGYTMYLVMELCAGGSLDTMLRLHGNEVSTVQRVALAYQISNGLKWLHQNGIIHRDLACRNCLVQGNLLKLCDFGMSRTVTDPKIDPDAPQNVRWMAPELWSTGTVTYASDMYSFGVTLWELFNRPYVRPYDELKGYQVKKAVLTGYRLHVPEDMPRAVESLMQKCFDADPLCRPTSEQAEVELGQILMNVNRKRPATSRSSSSLRRTRT